MSTTFVYCPPISHTATSAMYIFYCSLCKNIWKLRPVHVYLLEQTSTHHSNVTHWSVFLHCLAAAHQKHIFQRLTILSKYLYYIYIYNREFQLSLLLNSSDTPSKARGVPLVLQKCLILIFVNLLKQVNLLASKGLILTCQLNSTYLMTKYVERDPSLDGCQVPRKCTKTKKPFKEMLLINNL